jgi:hypothetical protein
MAFIAPAIAAIGSLIGGAVTAGAGLIGAGIGAIGSAAGAALPILGSTEGILATTAAGGALLASKSGAPKVSGTPNLATNPNASIVSKDPTLANVNAAGGIGGGSSGLTLPPVGVRGSSGATAVRSTILGG